ncbi:unnamed protein product [Clonostachys rhizophaga]|uniref:SPT2 chromatin protein n=1 Tax=Clonostachys rhizophaga TaxID=160324 RepID=A0A9N9VS32_9HYPO|nr:unnamed protein product [Clonostachys rhizophaga]
MAIGDLLASIGGGEPAPKRKAEEQLQIASKAPRINSPTVSRPIQPSRPLDRPNSTQSTNGNGVRSTVSSALKPTNGTHRITKPSAPVRSSSNGPSPASAAASRAPPKKGSFAEIMARAKAAQETMGQVGKIQHKKVEKGVMKKEKEVLTKPDPRAKVDPRLAGKKPVSSSSYTGTSKASARPTALVSSSRDPSRGKPAARPSDRDRRQPAEEVEKKQKKAATATTGYTGTARPKPGSTTSKHDKAPRGGALLNRPAPRAGASRFSRYEDDYDEELDDFIDYDDEEEGEPRYRYDSGSESDMEAGMDDLELEERKAESIARREDELEQRREKQLKAEKEDRRRRYLQGR